jgi:CubicO group peptidase (beta-lactamase class C family)
VTKNSGIFFLLQAFTITTTYCQKPAVDSFVTSEMKRLHLPGFEACAIDSGKVVWTGYYGFQHIGKHIPVSRQTLFDVASTTKTITGAALMQLYAAGRFKLDEAADWRRIVNGLYEKVF